MVGYFSQTNGRRNLAVLQKHGWRCLLTPYSTGGPHGLGYAIDNGAWHSFAQGVPYDAARFRDLLAERGPGSDWCVVPDIVEGGLESLAFSRSWLPEVLQSSPRALVAVQDGMTRDDVRPLLGPRVGIAVGGSTEWKERTARYWGRLAAEVGTYLHVLRVNTVRRIAICADAGADSFDGSSVSRFSCNVPRLTEAARQQSLWSPHVS